MMQALLRLIHRLEDSLLVLMLSAMIGLACLQIVSRNFFDVGFVWIDPFLRVLVLWLGLIGATVASRDNRHIRIDLLSRFFSKNTHRLLQSGVGFFSTFICLVIAWFGFAWIEMDYTDGMTGVAGIPAWMLEVIIPLSFALIGVRYLALSVCQARSYIYYLSHAEVADE